MTLLVALSTLLKIMMPPHSQIWCDKSFHSGLFYRGLLLPICVPSLPTKFLSAKAARKFPL
jgi:hypothetical protein